MSDLAFIWLWGGVLLVFQQAFRGHIGPLSLEFDFVTLLVIYMGFSFSFWRGFIGVLVLSFVSETLSYSFPGMIVISHLMIYMILQFFIDQILTEAYLTKMLWVMMASLAYHFLGSPEGGSPKGGSLFFWSLSATNAVLAALLSFPLFILLDATRDRWTSLFSRQKAQLTGADFFAVKSGQRKYLK